MKTLRRFVNMWRACARIGNECYLPSWAPAPQGSGYTQVDVWGYLAYRLFGGWLFGFWQAYGSVIAVKWEDGKHVRRSAVPFFPAHWACQAHYSIARWIEKRGVRYRWNAADSGVEGEVGFHSLSDGTKKRSPMRIVSVSLWESPTPDEFETYEMTARATVEVP